jgi:hypothetical protein
MYSKSSVLLTSTTTAAAVVTALIAGAVLLSPSIMTSTYAESHRHEHNFCFTSDDSGAPAASSVGASFLTTIHCYSNMGDCKKAEESFVSENNAAVSPCAKDLNYATA